MTRADFIALLPMLITCYSGVALMGIVAFWRGHAAAFVLTLVGLGAAFASIFFALPGAPRDVTGLIRIDAYSLFYTGLILAGAILVTLLSRDYLETHEANASAYYVLLICAVLGMIAIASSAHFASFFLGLETLSVSLYGLIGYTRRHKPSLEGAIKYLVLAAVSSAFLVFGIALIYAETGTMGFSDLYGIYEKLAPTPIFYFGLAMLLVGFGFKLALVPFHMWSPDVYQGAPAPVTALIATGSKGAVLALLLRLTTFTDRADHRAMFIVFAVLAVATMFGGNLLALLQSNVKRMLAYSSIAQVGYLLIPLLAGTAAGVSSIAFYLVSYTATTIAAFGVISVVSASRGAGDAESVDDYRGLALRNPAIAGVMALSLLSLTGIPLTSGFVAKFYIFSAAVRVGLWPLVILGIINSGISAFYYLRVLTAMYVPSEGGPADRQRIGLASGTALTLCAIAIVAFGIYPAPLVALAESATRILGFWPHQ